MPDFERITDNLSVDLASTPEEKAYAKGVIAGKNKARTEVLILFATIYFSIVAIGKMSQ